MSLEASTLCWLRGQRCAAHGGEQRFISEAGASPRPHRHLLSIPGAASNFAASVEYDRKRGTHHELCKTDFDLDTVPAASIMAHTAFVDTQDGKA